MHLQCIYLQCIYNVFTMYLQCIYNVFAMFLQCFTIYNISTICLQFIYNVFTMFFTMNLQCIYNVFTMYLQCIYTQRRSGNEWRDVPGNSIYDTPVKHLDGRTWSRPPRPLYPPMRPYQGGNSTFNDTPIRTRTLSPRHTSTPVNPRGVHSGYDTMPLRSSERRRTPVITGSRDTSAIAVKDGLTYSLVSVKSVAGSSDVIQPAVSSEAWDVGVKRLQKRRTLIAVIAWTLAVS